MKKYVYEHTGIKSHVDFLIKNREGIRVSKKCNFISEILDPIDVNIFLTLILPLNEI